MAKILCVLYDDPVLVQREMENWRSPPASIPPSSGGQLAEPRPIQVADGGTGSR